MECGRGSRYIYFLIFWENHDPAQVTVKLYHMLYRVHLACAAFELTTSVVIGTDCIGSCKSNYHIITTTTAPHKELRKNINVDIFYLFNNDI